MSLPLLSVRIHDEQDVVAARRQTRVVAAHLGFTPQDQTRLATAVSELSRNAFQYAGGGRVEFQVQPAQHHLVIVVSDHGPGITSLREILAGQYLSTTGMGVGLVGTRRLVDTFKVDTAPGRTVIRLGKRLPGTATVSHSDLDRLARAVADSHAVSPLQELQVQNQELLGALESLGRREEQLAALNHELENTNRGVVALYGELEEQATQLREANRVQAMFLSYMSHEFRTPLSSILGLTRLLIERDDGELTGEQERQVQLMQRSARELLSMVDDLLDQARLQSGRTELQISEFEITVLFAALRALFQPLVSNPQVRLVFGETSDVPLLSGDEGKTSRILRNFISNALKFTAAGEIHVWASVADDGRWVTLGVSDTGVGISAADQTQLFQDFSQVGPTGLLPVGSGLGLSLARQLAEQLGGQVQVSSAQGEGSTFSVTLPVRLQPPAVITTAGPGASLASGPQVLLIDDAPGDRDLLRRILARWGLTAAEAASGRQGLMLVVTEPPDLIVLDLNMPEMDGIAFLEALRTQPNGSSVPVVVVTDQPITPGLAAHLTRLGAVALNKTQVFGDDGVLLRAIAAPLNLRLEPS